MLRRASVPLARQFGPPRRSLAFAISQPLLQQQGKGGAHPAAPVKGAPVTSAPAAAAPAKASPAPAPPAPPSAPAGPHPALATPVFIPNFGAPTRGEKLSLQLRLKAYHKFYLNRFVLLLVERFRELGLDRPSQVFLPNRTERFTVLRSPHVDKKARDQFERVTHKRLITFTMPRDSAGIELAYRLLSGIVTLTPGVEVRAKYIVTGMRAGE